MDELNKTELPVEVCKDKKKFVEDFLTPLLKASDPLITSVDYEYFFNSDSAIDETVEVYYADSSFFTINVSRDSKRQLVIDVVQVLDRERKISPNRTLGAFIEELKQGNLSNDVRIFFQKSWREDVEFNISKILHNVGGYAETDIILKKA